MNPSIEPLGDSGVIVAWRSLEEDAAWRAVQSAAEQIDRNRIQGVVGVAPAFMSLTVYYNCEELTWTNLEAWIAQSLDAVPLAAESTRRLLEIPVCYDNEFALDITAVAAEHDLNTSDVVDLHSCARYTVQMIGFSPGFPYPAGLPVQLNTPRRASPRVQVPAGSVAIGGAQTGIYSQNSPGGWNIIGRTPVRLFDPQRDPPCLLRPGDMIKFVPIDRKQLEYYAESR